MKDIIQLELIFNDITNIINNYSKVETYLSYSKEDDSEGMEITCYIQSIKTAEGYNTEPSSITYIWDNNDYTIDKQKVNVDNPYKAFQHFLDKVEEAVNIREQEEDRSISRNDYAEYKFNKGFMKHF